MKVIRTPVNDKFIDEAGILQIIVREDAEFTVDNMKEDHKANVELTNGKKVLALIDARANFTATKEAADYIRSGILNKERIATAIVSNNLSSRLLMNFYLKLKVKTPIKLFREKEDAMKWLLSFQK